MKRTLMEKRNICYLYDIKLKKGDYAVKSMIKRMKGLLPTGIAIKIVYAGNIRSIHIFM